MQDRRKFLRTQILVSIAVGSAFAAAFVWLIFGGQDRIGLWGTAGLAFDVAMTTFMMILMMSFAVTMITRAAIKAGQLGASTKFQKLPRSTPARSLLFALLALAIAAPFTVAVLASLWSGAWGFSQVLLFKIAYCALLGGLTTPIVIDAECGATLSS